MALLPLCVSADIPDGEMVKAMLPDGAALAVYNVAGQIYVTSDVCTHGEVSLTEEGSLNGKIVECGWHFGAFDVTTGEAVAMPCSTDIKTYHVRIVEGVVHVEA